MSVRGIIFVALALVGAAINFCSRSICEKFGTSELKIKITALAIVLLSVILLFIFGK